MGQALQIATKGEADRKRKTALGPSERKAMPSAVERILHRGKLATRAERRPIIAEAILEVVKEEALDIGSFGGAEVHEVAEALERGERAEAMMRLLHLGVAAHHAFELIEKITEIHGLPAGHAVGMGAAGTAMSALAISLVQTQLAMAAIAQAHADGEREGAMFKYAEVWSELVVERLYDGGAVRPKHEVLHHLEQARDRAVVDAIITLGLLDADRAALADQLRQELGTRSNAKHALMDAILSSFGMRGILSHAEVR